MPTPKGHEDLDVKVTCEPRHARRLVKEKVDARVKDELPDVRLLLPS